MPRDLKEWGIFALCLMLCLGVGGLGSFFTAPAIDGWYAGLVQPPFAPPNWLFAPVWTLLYIVMGLSFYLVLAKGRRGRLQAVAAGLFLLQLALNALWSPVFFGLKDLPLSVALILLLDITVLITAYFAFRVSKAAGWLLVPYLAWISFATALTIAFLMLNE